MEIRLVMKTARSVSLELDDGGIYKTKEVYRILVNGDEVKTTDTVITSLYGLKPDTDYEIGVEDAHGTRQGEIAFRTDYEFVTLNVRKFGAKGDGVSDDTTFIQAAIMACPPESRVLIPAGTYKITSLFLKSGISVELAKGAELLADTDRSHYAILPGLIESYDETGATRFILRTMRLVSAALSTNIFPVRSNKSSFLRKIISCSTIVLSIKLSTN